MIWALLLIWMAGGTVCGKIGREAWSAEPTPEIRARIFCVAALVALFWPMLVVFAAVVVGLEMVVRRSRPPMTRDDAGRA